MIRVVEFDYVGPSTLEDDINEWLEDNPDHKLVSFDISVMPYIHRDGRVIVAFKDNRGNHAQA